MGVNDQDFDPEKDIVISNASCTTNCFVPMVKVIDDEFHIVSGLMTTVHSYTNDQNLLDLPHKDLRRARAAATNIVPTGTGAARATGLVLAAMKGHLDGTSLRVPLPAGSITDFTAVVKGNPSVADVNTAFATAAAKPPLERFLEYTDEPIVSSDIVGSPASCTFDSELTMVMRDRRRALAGQDVRLVRQRVGLLQPAGGPDRPGRSLSPMDPLRGIPLLGDLPDVDGKRGAGAGRLQRPVAHRGPGPGHRGRRLPHHGRAAHPAPAAGGGGRRGGLPRTSGGRAGTPTRAGRWTRCATGCRPCAPAWS